MLRTIAVLFIFFLSSLGHAQNLSDIEFGSDSTFDIVTWNIENFPKNGVVTIDSVAEIITSLSADIIACQEIDDTTFFNNMIHGLTDYSAIYDPNNFEGLAYIYNTNTVQFVNDYTLFTNGNFWRPFPRAPYFLEAIYEGETYTFINNHFKCCGDGLLDTSDFFDEEDRRLEASTLLESHISTFLPGAKVILLGDLNDILTDLPPNNAFQPFYDAPNDYQFVNQQIAEGPSANWSFPSWPSHLDHILISNELFTDFNHPATSVSTIRIDDYLPNGFSDYDNDITDHRPVGLKLFTENSSLSIHHAHITKFFNVYPNPAKNSLTIELAEGSNGNVVYIYNAIGQLMIQKPLANHTKVEQIATAHLPQGIYFISIKSNGLLIGQEKLLID